MRDALQYQISGIKCDNPKCDFVDWSVELKDYPNWLNKPCPKCGANLLTQADYDNVTMIVGLADKMNRALPKSNGSDPVSVATIRMNGTGKIDIDIE